MKDLLKEKFNRLTEDQAIAITTLIEDSFQFRIPQQGGQSYHYPGYHAIRSFCIRNGMNEKVAAEIARFRRNELVIEYLEANTRKYA